MKNKRFFPFKYKLFILLFFSVFLVSSILASFQFFIMHNNMEDDFSQKQKLVHDRALNMIKNADYVNLLNEKPIEEEAEIILRKVWNEYKEDKNIDFNLSSFIKDKDDYQLYIIDSSNTVIRATDPKDLGLNFTGYTDFLNYLDVIRASGIFSTSRVSLSIKSGDLMKYCYISSYDGKYIFETGTKLETDKTSNVAFEDFEHQLLDENSFISSILLYDYQGVSYKKDAAGKNIKISSNHEDYFKQALDTMKTVEVTGTYLNAPAHYEYIPYEIVGARGANERNVIEIIYNNREARNKLRYMEGVVALVVILSSAVVASIGYYIASRLVKPIEELTIGAKEVAEGNLSYRFKMKINDETGILGKQFNHMTEEISRLLDERYKYEKNLQTKNQEIINQKEEISALYEETSALNEELEDMLRQNSESYFETVRALANAIDEKDAYTGGHCERVMEYSMKIAAEMGLNESELNDLKFGSILHDIGKIGIAENILNKEGKLSQEEYGEIKKHPIKGDNILKNLNFLTNCRRIIHEHHERIDGKGYPGGLDGDHIYFLAKIVCVADAYDAMTSCRPYRNGELSKEQAIEEMLRNKGTQFDPEIVDAFISYLNREE